MTPEEIMMNRVTDIEKSEGLEALTWYCRQAIVILATHDEVKRLREIREQLFFSMDGLSS